MRIIIAAIVGGIIVFVWSAVAHIFTPLGQMGLGTLPDDAIVETLRNAPASGMYYFPRMDMTRRPTPEEEKAYAQKLASGPSGLVIFTKSGNEMMSPRQLGTEFASNVAAALIAACLLAMMIGSWLKRASAVALFGVFGVVSLLVSYWIWYSFPPQYILGELIMELVGWFLAGLVMAKIVRPPFGAIAPAR